MMSSKHYSKLFRSACWVVKHFLLFLLGFSLFCLISSALGASNLALMLLSQMWQPLLRGFFIVLMLLMLSIIYESVRS